jgi:hypothetical protein
LDTWPEGRHLPGDRLDDRGVGVTQRVDGDAGHEVDVRPSVAVPDGRAVAADEREAGVAYVGMMTDSHARSRPHLRADALVGEQLHEQRVRDAAVQDVSLGDSAAHRSQARLHLRDHAAGRVGSIAARSSARTLLRTSSVLGQSA